MNQLNELIINTGADIFPAQKEIIKDAEIQLNIRFSIEYKQWLENVGVLSYESYEVFGLGIPETSWLNILKSTQELRVENNKFPVSAVPLLDAGDGAIYLYENNTCKILLWSSLVGIIQVIDESIEQFIIEKVFA